MPNTIVSADSPSIRGSEAGRCIDYCQNGVLWVALGDDSGTSPQKLRFYYSSNEGVNWTESTSSALDDASAGAYPASVSAAIFIDKDDYCHLVYYSALGSTGQHWRYRVGTPNAGRTSWTWSSAIILPVASASGDTPLGADIVAHRQGTGYKAHIIHTGVVSTTSRIRYYRIDLDASHVPTLGLSDQELYNWAVSADMAMSMDFRHTEADPKVVQSDTPSLYIVHTLTNGTSSLRFKKITYSAGAWSLPGSDVSLDAGGVIGLAGNVQGVYDGTRFVVVYALDATGTVVHCKERDEADTTTTARDPTALADGNLRRLGIAYRPGGDIYLVAKAATSFDWKKIRYNRGAASWDAAWTLIEADTNYAGAFASEHSLMRGIDELREPILGFAYRVVGGTPDSQRFASVYTRREFVANLQGVGTLDGTKLHQKHAVKANLQGVGTIEPRLHRIPPGAGAGWTEPALDFTVYDAYLEGDGVVTGHIYFEDENSKPATVNRELRAVRQDTGQNPFEVRPESGDVFSQGDFSHGIEQIYYHAEGRDHKKYFWSEGFDISKPGILRHLHDTASVAYKAGTTGANQLAQFDGKVFISDGDKVYRSTDLSTWVEEDPGGATNATITALAASGQHLYAACGADGIFRRTTAGVWSQWSTVQAKKVAWLKSRIIAATATSFYSLVTGTESAIETLPAGWEYTSLFEAGAFIYATAMATGDASSEIRHFKLDASLAVVSAGTTPMPRNQLATGGRGYLNVAYIGVGKTASGGSNPIIYQGFPDDNGFLNLVKLAEGVGANSDLSVVAFEPVGEAMLCGYSLGSGSPFGSRSGLAFHDLRKDAFYAHLNSKLASGARILSILSYKGTTLFTVEGVGLYKEDLSKYVLQAKLWSSLGDWSTAAPKTWDQLSVSHTGLPSGCSVEVHYTKQMQEDNAYTPALTSSLLNSTGASINIGNQVSRLFGVKLISNAKTDQTLAPEINSFGVRSNPTLDTPEFVLTRYIRLIGRDRKDGQGETVFKDPDAARRAIQMLVFRWVRLYEPGVVWTVRLKQIADVEPMEPIYDETTGEALKDVFIMQLTLEGTRN